MTGVPASWSSTEITWDSLVATWGDLAPPRAPLPTRLDVGIWQPLSGSTWQKVGEVRTWTTVNVEPRHNDPGLWSLAMPYDVQAAAITKAHLFTFDLTRNGRTDRILTGVQTSVPLVQAETGGVALEVSGMGVLGVLGPVLVWPNPPNAEQPPPLDGGGKQRDPYWIAVGRTETVLRDVVAVNWTTRLGKALKLPPDQGRGIANTTLHERFSNLLPLLTTKCEAAGLGVRMGLVDTASSTRAELTLEFYTPQDRSQRVRLSHDIGSLRTWKQTDNAPTVTRAIVAGGGKGLDRIFLERRDAATEAAWGGWPVEVFIDSRGTKDIGELTASAQDALTEGAAQSAFELEAVEPEGIRLFQHFGLGDIVTVSPLEGVEKTDRLRAVQIEATGPITIKLVPGLPDAASPLFQQAALIRTLNRRIRALEREEG